MSWGGDGDGEPHPSFRVGRVTRALPACGLGTAAASPAETKILTTLVRESNGLYTVVSTLFSKVTREDRNSLFHCTVHYWLQGQMRTKDSPRVNVTVFYPTEHVELRVATNAGIVKEGDDVKLVCDADGNPAPVFSFFRREVRGSGPSPSASPVPGRRG